MPSQLTFIEAGGTNQLEMLLARIIENSDIRIVFQPIISLRDGEVLGYEALSRGPAGSPLQSPDALFGVAANCGKLWDLEQLCRTKALEAAYKNAASFKLFLNVNPSVIHDEKFKHGFTKEYLMNFDIDPSNIFFEITEKNAITDPNGFKRTIDHYKNQDYKIAIDDAGAGYSGLNLIADVRPHYIKLDMNLVRDIDKDSYKKTLVKSLYDFCCLSEVMLIAEGIETEAELRALVDIGVHYGQGYFIQYPESEISEINPGVLESIHISNAQKNNTYRTLSSFYIGNLCSDGVTVFPTDNAGDVYNHFLKDENLLGITVINEQKDVLGTISKMRIDHAMSGQYGYSLYAKRPIAIIMDTKPLVKEFTTPIDVVSKLAMSRSVKTLYDFIVVTRDMAYLGVVTIKDLLEKTMEIEVSNSRNLNPLSGLPGNIAIEQTFERHIASNEPFTALYIDLDNFKAYNDVYGFAKGDDVIKFVAQLLEEIIPAQSFVGHIGGDDFVAVLSTHNVDDACNIFIKRFDEGIRAFYTEADLELGYIKAKNRKGEEDQFPLMAVSIAGVSNKNRAFKNVNELAEYASAIKKQCKQFWNSCLLVG